MRFLLDYNIDISHFMLLRATSTKMEQNQLFVVDTLDSCKRLKQILDFCGLEGRILASGDNKLHAVLEHIGAKGGVGVLIATPLALGRFLSFDADLDCKDLYIGQHIVYECLAGELVSLGFERVSCVDCEAQFILTGETLVLHNGFNRYRVVLSGDHIESIYDLDSDEICSKITIYRLQECPPKMERIRNKIECLFDFVLFTVGTFEESFGEELRLLLEKHSIKSFRFSSFPADQSKYIEMSDVQYEAVSNFFEIGRRIKNSPLELFVQYCNANRCSRILLALDRNTDLLRVQELLKKRVIFFVKVDRFGDIKDGLSIAYLPISKGFAGNDLDGNHITVITGHELFRRRNTTKSKKNRLTQIIKSSIEVGDLVIHRDYGLGRFLGIEDIRDCGFDYQCLLIGYRDGDKLFIPVEYARLITRYSSDSLEAAVMLDKLKGSNWQKRQARAKQRIQLIADELLRIAAIRKKKEGKICQIPQSLHQLSSIGFDHTLTEDQVAALDAVESDLSRGTVMNRLICGDTGFGKTEVALRAAFIVLFSDLNNQVAVLTPTTLLTRQFFNVFVKRFEGSGITIEHLSSMTERKSVSRIKNDLRDGRVRVIIGTHSVLSCQFKNLVMLVIDEEHCFGVKQKEALKKEYSGIHVLYLSATPIPRSLHMSLSGIYDFSVLATPPSGHKETQVFIIKDDHETIKQAIINECERGGQIFIVSPRIKDIKEILSNITSMVAGNDYQIAVTHGDMPRAELERTIDAFCREEYKILVTTTIIESGIDIPKVNTIIVYHAELLGVSQLYQLKGRVGRRILSSFAYFILSDDCEEKAIIRLQSIKSLKTSMEIATCDMDNRGFGNLIGEDQAGHIKEVGVELYHQMLSEAMSATDIGIKSMVKVDFNVSKGIPDDYINCFTARMHYYNLISKTEDIDELELLEEEIEQKFGPMPDSVINLILLLKIQNAFASKPVTKLYIRAKHLKIEVESEHILDILAYMSEGAITPLIEGARTLIIKNQEGSELLCAEKAIKVAQTMPDRADLNTNT